MVRKGGLEPPCLSAPPPQDGVSANSTTSAGCAKIVQRQGHYNKGQITTEDTESAEESPIIDQYFTMLAKD